MQIVSKIPRAACFLRRITNGSRKMGSRRNTDDPDTVSVKTTVI
jgi:hypothetical protein